MTPAQIFKFIDLFTDVWAWGRHYLPPETVVEKIAQYYRCHVDCLEVMACYANKGVAFDPMIGEWVKG